MLDKKIISIADMKKGDQGEVWLAVDGEGIWRCGFDEQGNLKVQEKFDRSRGIATEVFNNLLIDREGNVWIGHYQGLTVIRKNKVVLNFDQNDGWPFKNYNNLFLHQDRDGMFWAGCSKAFCTLAQTRCWWTLTSPGSIFRQRGRREIIRRSRSPSPAPCRLNCPTNSGAHL